MVYQSINYFVERGVATIAMNRPETLNALNDDMLSELYDAIKRAERSREVRAVILTGQGRGFSSGQDLKSFQHAGEPRDIGAHLDQFYHPLIQRLAELDKPTIAMVNGVAAGAGMSLALVCDLRVASDSARFTQAFVRIGLVPDSGSSYFLPRLIGYARALEMTMTGMMVDAVTALQWGLVNRVVPQDHLVEETTRLAIELAEGAPLALGMIKREIAYGLAHPLHETLEREKDFQIQAAETDDHQQAVQAFFLKKPPVFEGR